MAAAKVAGGHQAAHTPKLLLPASQPAAISCARFLTCILMLARAQTLAAAQAKPSSPAQFGAAGHSIRSLPFRPRARANKSGSSFALGK